MSEIPATLWLTMWTECEEFVSLNEDAYYVSNDVHVCCNTSQALNCSMFDIIALTFSLTL